MLLSSELTEWIGVLLTPLLNQRGRAVIDRYSRPAMKRVWSANNKFEEWLEVELRLRAWARKA